MGVPTAGGVDVATLRAVTAALSASALAGPSASSAGDRIERIAVLEQLRSVVAAAQATEVAAFAAEQRGAVEVEIATVERPGVGRTRRREQARRAMVARVGLARRISPWQAGRFVAFSEQARTDLPETFRLLATGKVSERRAGLVFTAVNPLDPEQRRHVDGELAPELPGWGDRKVDQRARAAVYRIDPAGVVERNAYALGQRRVSVRPAPEGMAWTTALTSMPDAVAMRAQLERDATAAIAAGDPRSRGQVMADLVVERVTGRASAGTGPVAIQLVMSDRTLLGGDEPARFPDGTPYPAPLARDLAFGDCTADSAAARSVRRLFTDPAGRLVTGETNSRNFTPAMRDLVRLRDGLCTTPWCDAPIEDIDHVHPHVRGGPTSITNAEGTCRWCNHTKGDRPPDVATGVPPGPTRPGARPRPEPPPGRSPVERRARRHVRRAIRRSGRAPVVLVELTAHR